MLNDRWAKRIMRAAKTEVVIGNSNDAVEARIVDNKLEGNIVNNCVKNHEAIMTYLKKENASGHAHNLDMLLNSLNVNQHLREAFLSASVKEDAENNCYIIEFPFGIKTIEYKLSKKAIDNAAGN